ncbi:oxidoreductase [Agrobacterium vitis]|uniref:oxidoreductase n=1 Tax=Agrobacterium vitis TaxID=373 RepID=UPI0012E94E97|nr:oxidoreductase [Agrobacterium vitis]MUZ65645.1 SDR family NAD(P)-dependent oxidoreductase [Agrobacterium vitis]
MTDTTKSFFITGISSGFGKALATEALADGHRVVGTLRDRDSIAMFEAQYPGRAFGKLLDITHISAIPAVIAEVEDQIGPIDVLVNNAGYGQEGTIEESPIDEMRRQFEVNVFGTVAVTKAVLPYMRQRRSGHIITITSMGGLTTYPGLGYYHGSKFALEGLSETLAKEVKSFGIAVTAVEPGAFRTEWAGRSMTRTTRSISDYDELFEPLREARKQRSGRQAGDPVKAARAILKAVASENPPGHLLLGEDAVQFVREKLAGLRAEIDAWESTSLSTAFD